MMKRNFNFWQLVSIALGFFPFMLMALPACAAERIYLNYDPFNFSFSVNALKNFANDGKIDQELAFFLDRLNPQQQAELREFLRTRYNVNPVMLYRLGNSYAGKQLLTLIGRAIQLPGGQNGYYALRGAIISSALTPEGVSVINVLRNFSTNIQLDINYLRQTFRRIIRLIEETNTFVEELRKLTSADQNSQVSPQFQSRFLLQKSGQFVLSKQSFNLQDNQRNRSLKGFIYLPQTHHSNIPVILISSGLGSKYDRFNFLADHLASHGFAVVILEHPNSDDKRQADFYAGFYQEPFDATEFVDRPLDITFLLNYLQQVNKSQFQGQLNLTRVGIFGYSFGGTTAFALGGAQVNFEQLHKDCHPPDSLINISTLYQCRALELPEQSFHLQDNRIQAAFVFVPFGKSLYGQAQMNRVTIPIFWQATSEDIITPLLIEQIPTFLALPNHNKYLLISEKLPHAQIVLNVMNRLLSRELTVEKVEQVTQDYLKAMTLAFFMVYIADNEYYRLFLQSSYTKILSEEPFNLFLLGTEKPPIFRKE